ncbi:cytochrome aa3 quinol oxidase subunit II [Lederbergia wuyishanensis]|uniref:Quinol oxidase subunit 2 n=1 Tax=Lederbergia wuyishanensis TaxID=1347903 RepID=A0ABU0D7T1_9BACI|nr:cytochrome aa3 quinol oxidase subunit II [Lederbergia wuyishanensis]MCJ8009091.1 cytochrome aa3 quinol oxidase subunit II [Lederbergia wuyishanensis]MDQ0344428.1 cytochrome aa3-600 menaquinol oxidase subunit 2 [Lederbergia wuyishanensis]
MKMKWAFLSLIAICLLALTGCEPLMVLDPKGPQAETQANVIWISIATMAFIVIVVFALLIFVVTKYRASKQSDDYEPPHIEGHPVVESIIVGIPVVIIIFLSIVTVKSTYEVEATPKGYEDQKPLTIYASSSDWKWHFSYPEENIETVNYLYIPTDRPLEFKLYSYGPITSFWIPQLGGQKYAMSDMVTTLHLAASVPGEFMGRNANFSGKGFAENTFQVKAMPQKEFDEWVEEVKATAEPLTEEKFKELLEPGHLGQLTFSGTHLTFLPAPEGEYGGHHHGSNDSHEGSKHDHDEQALNKQDSHEKTKEHHH